MPTDPVLDQPREREQLDYDYERDVLTLASAGRWAEGEWRKGESREEHARYFKNTIVAIIKSAGAVFSVGKSEVVFLHPGMQASIKMGRNVVGVFGAIHPEIRSVCDLREVAFYAELDLRLIAKFMAKPNRLDVSDFPAIARDVTLMVSRKDQAGRVLRILGESQVAALKDVFIVDDFAKSGEDFRRITYRVTFQSVERTLRHEEVDSAMAALLENLKEKHGIQLC